jgi:hypothetical protein
LSAIIRFGENQSPPRYRGFSGPSTFISAIARGFVPEP